MCVGVATREAAVHRGRHGPGRRTTHTTQSLRGRGNKQTAAVGRVSYGESLMTQCSETPERRRHNTYKLEQECTKEKSALTVIQKRPSSRLVSAARPKVQPAITVLHSCTTDAKQAVTHACARGLHRSPWHECRTRTHSLTCTMQAPNRTPDTKVELEAGISVHGANYSHSLSRSTKMGAGVAVPWPQAPSWLVGSAEVSAEAGTWTSVLSK